MGSSGAQPGEPLLYMLVCLPLVVRFDTLKTFNSSFTVFISGV